MKVRTLELEVWLVRIVRRCLFGDGPQLCQRARSVRRACSDQGVRSVPLRCAWMLHRVLVLLAEWHPRHWVLTHSHVPAGCACTLGR